MDVRTKKCFPAAPVMRRTCLTSGHPSACRKSGPKRLCLCCFSSLIHEGRPRVIDSLLRLATSESDGEICQVPTICMRSTDDCARTPFNFVTRCFHPIYTLEVELTDEIGLRHRFTGPGHLLTFSQRPPLLKDESWWTPVLHKRLRHYHILQLLYGCRGKIGAIKGPTILIRFASRTSHCITESNRAILEASDQIGS